MRGISSGHDDPESRAPLRARAELERAADEGGASLFVNGIDPGFANDWLPLVLTGVSERIEEVRCMEILNYATYDQPRVIFDIMGFGRSLDEVPLLLSPGILTTAWGSVIRRYFLRRARWGWLPFYGWFQDQFWLKMPPRQRRIARLIIWTTALEFVVFLFVFIIYWLELGRT